MTERRPSLSGVLTFSSLPVSTSMVLDLQIVDKWNEKRRIKINVAVTQTIDTPSPNQTFSLNHTQIELI